VFHASSPPIEQSSADQLPDRLWDVAVIGAGPAGATAAAYLARAGHSALLIDRYRFPRDKVCGDAIIADTIAALTRLGALGDVEARAYSASVISVYSPSRVRVDVPGRFLTLKRVELDVVIARRAAIDGARIVRGFVTDVEPAGDCVRILVRGRATPIVSRFAILATGADVTLQQRLGVKSTSAPSAIALRCYVRSPRRIDRPIISYDREILPGYAWIFPLRHHEYNIGCGIFFKHVVHRDVNLRTILDRFLRSFPEAAEIMREADAPTAIKGARIRSGLSGSEAACVPRVLSIGESIGATLPFTGEGIGKAMETGELAADTLHQAITTGNAGVLSSFGRRVSAELGPRYLGYLVAERWLSRPWLNDLIARRTQRSPLLLKLIAGVLNETIDPRAIFSIRGLARSFLD
jgi:geranylgeranyl reductase family protein